MLRIAFYTCVTGGYDEVPSPQRPDPRYSYLVYTDQPASVPSPWLARPLPVSGLSNKDINRYVKMLPHRVPELTGYDLTVYLDGRITICEAANALVQTLCSVPNGLHMFDHYARDCLYEEAYVCAMLGLESPLVLGRQVRRYRDAGMPSRSGLFEGSVIVRRNSPEVAAFMERWWEEYNLYSKRDQISLPFLAWRHGVVIGSLGRFSRNGYFTRGRHTAQRSVLGDWGATRNRVIFKLARSLHV